MEYITRTVESRAGLSQEEALASLQDHPQFKAGTKIKSIRQHQDHWVAKLLEPKVAEFPPQENDDDDDDDDSEDGPEVEVKAAPSDSEGDSEDSGDDSGDSKPPFAKEGPDVEPELEAKGELGEVLGILHQIVEALGIGKPDGLPGVDEAFGEAPGPAAGGPPHKGPGRPPGTGAPKAPGAGPAGRPLRDVPPGTNPMSGFAKTIPSFTATTEESLSVKEAKADLEKTFEGYRVKQIKRQDGKLHALLSIR